MLLIPGTAWSLYAIPAAVVLAYIPHVFRTLAIKKYLGKYNNLAPMNHLATLEQRAKEGKVPKNVVDRIKRMDACHNNAFETIHIFHIAVLAGNYAGLNVQFMNAATGLYLLSRIIYTAIYINQSTSVAATSRTLTWAVGIAASLTILIRSANAVSAR